MNAAEQTKVVPIRYREFTLHVLTRNHVEVRYPNGNYFGYMPTVESAKFVINGVVQNYVS